jgi:hypothetical protein
MRFDYNDPPVESRASPPGHADARKPEALGIYLSTEHFLRLIAVDRS